MTDTKSSNEALARHQHEAISRGDLDGAVDDWADEVINHGRRVPRAGIRAVLADILKTFPDVRMDIDDLIADDRRVVVRCTMSGTHRGVGELPVNGGMLLGVQPTGKSIAVQHIHIYHVVDGKIAEHWATRDDLGMMQQLGLLPGRL
jgi:predicted ester cyclase